MAPQQTHAVLSVTKSVVGCVAGVLADRGLLDLDDATSWTTSRSSPSSGYAGATVRHLLDMRSRRARSARTTPTRRPRCAGSTVDRLAAAAAPTSGRAGSIRSSQTLRAEAPHGSRFLYRSAETDVLGWVCERAGGGADGRPDLDPGVGADGCRAGRRDHLRRTGHGRARRRACGDGAGPGSGSGRCCSTGERCPDEDGGARHRRTAEVAAPEPGPSTPTVATAFLDSPAERSFPGGWYRNQFWFRPGEHGDVLLCLGHPRPDAAREPPYPHRLREALELARRLRTRRSCRTRCARSTPWEARC